MTFSRFVLCTVVFSGVAYSAVAEDCSALRNTEKSGGLSFGADAQKTTAIGAGLGGLIGGAIGNNTGEGDSTQGALIGAGLGAIAGAAVGQVAEDRRQAFETESQYLDCEIAATEKLVASHDARIVQAEADVAAAEANVDAMLVRINDNTADAVEIRSLQNEINAQAAAQQSQLNEISQEIAHLDSLATIEAFEGEDSSALAQRKQRLAAQRAELFVRYNSLSGVNERMLVAAGELPAQG